MYSTKIARKRKRTALFLVQLYCWRRAIACDQVQNILFDCAQINEANYLHKSNQQNLPANANELFCSWSNFIGAVRLPVIKCIPLQLIKATAAILTIALLCTRFLWPVFK